MTLLRIGNLTDSCRFIFFSLSLFDRVEIVETRLFGKCAKKWHTHIVWIIRSSDALTKWFRWCWSKYHFRHSCQTWTTTLHVLYCSNDIEIHFASGSATISVLACDPTKMCCVRVFVRRKCFEVSLSAENTLQFSVL